MGIFWRLVLAHVIADFTLQTNLIANWKRASQWGMLAHALTHPVIAAALAWPYLDTLWVQTRWFHWTGWVCIGFITLFHWLQDEWRVWAILRTGAPDSTKLFLWDQLVHLAILLAFAPALPGESAPAWVIVALCAALLAHFTSVLIYFIENDLWGVSHVLEGKKYLYIGERLLGASLFLLPGAWLIMAAGWMGWMVYQCSRHAEKRTWVHWVANCAVILLGLIARRQFAF